MLQRPGQRPALQRLDRRSALEGRPPWRPRHQHATRYVLSSGINCGMA